MSHDTPRLPLTEQVITNNAWYIRTLLAPKFLDFFDKLCAQAIEAQRSEIEPTKEQRQAISDMLLHMRDRLGRGEEINWLAMPHEVWRALREAGGYVPAPRSATALLKANISALPEAAAFEPKAFATMPRGILTRCREHADSDQGGLSNRDGEWLYELVDELTRTTPPSPQGEYSSTHGEGHTGGVGGHEERITVKSPLNPKAAWPFPEKQ